MVKSKEQDVVKKSCAGQVGSSDIPRSIDSGDDEVEVFLPNYDD